MTVADILTTIRFILTPVFIAFYIAGQPEWAILLFCVAGFTDMIDGTVARILKQPSQKGAVLDPLADKFLVESCFVLLTFSGVLPWWFFLLALGRDVMIVSGIFYLEHKKIAFPYRATWASKLATVMQLAIALMGLVMLWRPEIATASFRQLFFAAIVITASFIVISGAQYVSIGLHFSKQPDKKHEA